MAAWSGGEEEWRGREGEGRVGGRGSGVKGGRERDRGRDAESRVNAFDLSFSVEVPKHSRAKYAQVRDELGFFSGRVVQQSTSHFGLKSGFCLRGALTNPETWYSKVLHS